MVPSAAAKGEAMIFRECWCRHEDGCEECGRTGRQRQCETCGCWFPAERIPTMDDHMAPWSCDGCFKSCHTYKCPGPATMQAMRWLGPKGALNRMAMLVRLCGDCFARLDSDGEIVRGCEPKEMRE